MRSGLPNSHARKDNTLKPQRQHVEIEKTTRWNRKDNTLKLERQHVEMKEATWGHFWAGMERQSIHPVAIILITEFAQDFDGSIQMLHADGWVLDTIEHAGLDGGIVDHVLEDYLLAYL